MKKRHARAIRAGIMWQCSPYKQQEGEYTTVDFERLDEYAAMFIQYYDNRLTQRAIARTAPWASFRPADPR